MKAKLDIRISTELLEKLKKLAAKDNRKFSDYVRLKLEEL